MKLYLSAVKIAGETWKTVQQIPNYELVVGELLFRQIFEIAPSALSLYGFGQGYEPSGCSNSTTVPEAVFSLPSFQSHAEMVVRMLEGVIVQMLGDDMDSLAAAVANLGARHVAYGVHAAHYGIVETALLRTLAAGLGEEVFTDEVRKGWAAVFKFISKAMMSGAGMKLEIIKGRRRQLEHSKSATLCLQVMKRRTEGKANSFSISKDRKRTVMSTSRFQGSAIIRRNSDPPRIPSRLEHEDGDSSTHKPKGTSVDIAPVPPRRYSSLGICGDYSWEKSIPCDDIRPPNNVQTKDGSPKLPRKSFSDLNRSLQVEHHKDEIATKSTAETNEDDGYDHDDYVCPTNNGFQPECYPLQSLLYIYDNACGRKTAIKESNSTWGVKPSHGWRCQQKL